MGVHGKLVRDRVPQMLGNLGVKVMTRTAGSDEYWELLRGKLTEEVREFLESGAAEELADIIEVVHALAITSGISLEALELMRANKHSQRGGFLGRVVCTLEGNPNA